MSALSKITDSSVPGILPRSPTKPTPPGIKSHRQVINTVKIEETGITGQLVRTESPSPEIKLELPPQVAQQAKKVSDSVQFPMSDDEGVELASHCRQSTTVFDKNGVRRKA